MGIEPTHGLLISSPTPPFPQHRLPLLSARLEVTFLAEERRRTLTSTKLYCLVKEAHGFEQLAQGCNAALSQWELNPRPVDLKSNATAPPFGGVFFHYFRWTMSTFNIQLIVMLSLPSSRLHHPSSLTSDMIHNLQDFRSLSFIYFLTCRSCLTVFRLSSDCFLTCRLYLTVFRLSSDCLVVFLPVGHTWLCSGYSHLLTSYL